VGILLCLAVVILPLLVGAALARELAGLYGGCCGNPHPEGDLGGPEPRPGDPDCNPPDGEPCKPPPGCGYPVWSVNKTNMNFYVKDIPLWYRHQLFLRQQ
jgi:hypothetical protein